MTDKVEVNLIIPDPKDFYCINCKINPLNMQNPIIKSLFHCQILTCRLIMYSVRCCIASPSIESIELIHVIVSKKFYSTGKLQEHLLNLKVQFTNPEPVYLSMYETCLKYMFTFKLAPFWNLVGKFLYLHGFNFLSLPCSIDAVEWNIMFKGDHTKLAIKPIKINLFPFTLEYLSLTSSLINNFLKNSNCTINYINLSSFQSMWVYVLPRLTKARIISVSKTLPQSCPFENYDDLRRHWKNMYSYRLPKTDQRMLFYEVIFPMNPNKQFTYPEVCILSKMPEFIICENKNKVTSEFIKNLSNNVHSVCGKIIKIGNLFPKLNMEYSCVLKRKSDNYKDQNEYKSKSHYFKTSTDYIIKSTNEKLNTSSFTLSGFHKMSGPMKNYSQKVFSIMENQNQKKMTVINTNNQGLAMNDDSRKKFNKASCSQTSVQNQILVNERKTIIDNVDNICSYYDIPSMYSNKDSILNPINKNETTILDKKMKNLCNLDSKYLSIPSYLENAYSKQLSNKKPVIKNVKNVSFNLTDIKRIGNTHEIDDPYIKVEQNLNIKKIKQNYSIQNLFNSTNTSISFTDINSFYNLNNKKQLDNFMSSTISTMNSTLQNEISVQKPKDNDIFKSRNQTEFCHKLSSFLSRFNFYKIYQLNDYTEKIICSQNEIFNQCIEFESTKKLSPTLEYSSLQYSPSLLNKSEKLKNKKHFLKTLFHQLTSKSNQSFQFNTCNKDETSLYNSESLKSMINQKYNSQELKNYYDFQNNEINIKMEKKSSCNIELTNKIEEKIFEKLQYRNFNKNFDKNQKNIINKSQYLLTINGSINKKLSQICKSPISIFLSNSKLKNKKQGEKIDEYNEPAISKYEEKNLSSETKCSILDIHEKQNKKIQQIIPFKQNFQKNNFNSNTEYKTPFSIVSLNSSNKLENINGLELQCSPIIFITPSFSEIKNKNMSLQNKSNNCILDVKALSNSNELQQNLISKLKNANDSMSILSQSSNEFNYSNYESYKLVCTEALTFD